MVGVKTSIYKTFSHLSGRHREHSTEHKMDFVVCIKFATEGMKINYCL